MERYQNGKIYAIRSNETDDVYIGSTCLSLAKRLYKHRDYMRQYTKAGTHYMTSFKILEYADHYIELIELYPCNSKMELERREGQIMREHDTRVNKHLPGRDEKEYRETNKERIAAYGKIYRDDNKEQLAARHKIYREANKEQIVARKSQKIYCLCGKTHNRDDAARHKRSIYHIETMKFLTND